ncbi:hypothetical protein QBC38DRAFT_459354 [Podospora fimiseda]|uniref:Zn(2)-C6 fungal-type domain-containing protein n=1 Tax=Podospora fimiseda TaxID=252190 RepID=A0AAN7GNX1_9PEZI|nr:hypothetical protein QBC38DRAFT_459354 [Podospora fimiseda]
MNTQSTGHNITAIPDDDETEPPNGRVPGNANFDTSSITPWDNIFGPNPPTWCNYAPGHTDNIIPESWLTSLNPELLNDHHIPATTHPQDLSLSVQSAGLMRHTAATVSSRTLSSTTLSPATVSTNIAPTDSPFLDHLFTAQSESQNQTSDVLAVSLWLDAPWVSDDPIWQLAALPGPGLPSPLSSEAAPTQQGPIQQTDQDSEGRGKKRKVSTDDEPRRATKNTRLTTTACARCRIYRMKCDEGVICANCEKALGSAKIFHLPCFRETIKQLPEFRWSLDYPQQRKIQVSFLYPTSARHVINQVPFLRVNCRRFLPGLSSILRDSVEAPDGETAEVEFPPFACIDAASNKFQRAMNTYLDACQSIAEQNIDLSTSDEIVKLTLDEARRYGRSRTSGAFLSELQPVIVGADKLDVPVFENPKFPEHGQVMIPVALNYQLDVVYIRYLEQHFKEVVSKLNKLIFGRHDKRETWYETFLCIFVLLATLENVYKSQIAYVRKYAGSDGNVFASANYVKRSMLEEWQRSAKNLIYHFRVVSKGMVPFSQTWTQDLQETAGIDDESLAYIRKISTLVASRRDELSSLCCSDSVDESPQPLMWIGRLFLDQILGMD